MAKVLLDMSISLDGFICGPNGEDGGLYDWYFAPATGDHDPNQTIIAELVDNLGVIVMGRRAFGTGEDQSGFENDPYHATLIVLTHNPPAHVPDGPKTIIFVTDGVESALAKAQEVVGNEEIAIGGGANVAQQFLRAGLVDEIQLHLVPALLGKGVRLFENLENLAITLEKTRVVDATGVTHLQYRVVR